MYTTNQLRLDLSKVLGRFVIKHLTVSDDVKCKMWVKDPQIIETQYGLYGQIIAGDKPAWFVFSKRSQQVKVTR